MNASNFKIGATYSALKPYRAFNDLDGSLVEFNEERFTFVNLEKPSHVIVNDGFNEWKEKIPEHLASGDWLLVLREGKSKSSWLKIDSVSITGELI
jgi:hypothetical protein